MTAPVTSDQLARLVHDLAGLVREADRIRGAVHALRGAPSPAAQAPARPTPPAPTRPTVPVGSPGCPPANASASTRW